MDVSTLRRGLRLSVAEGALSTTMSTLAGGVFLTGFALALGASRFQIGVLAALPTLANVAQIAGSYLIERTGRRKSLCLWSAGMSRISWLAILAVPFVWPGDAGGHRVWWVAGLLVASSLLAAVAGVAWLSWIKDLVPLSHRASLFSRRNQIGTGLALSLSIAGGLFLDWWEIHLPGSLVGFALVFAFATACGVLALPLLRAIPEPAMSGEPSRPFPDLLARPLREPNFRRLVTFYAYWNLSVNLASPFFNVYMLQKLDLPFWYVTLLNTLAGLASLLANRFWMRLSDKFGNKPVVFLATLGNAFFPLWWIFIGPGWAWLLVPIHLSGLFNSPLVLAPNNIVLKLAPNQNGSAYMAVFNAAVGPATALASVAGGLLAGWLSGFDLSIGPLTLGGLKYVFLLSFVGRLTSLLLLRRLVEPEADGVGHVVRVLRRARILHPIRSMASGRQLRREPRHAAPAHRAPHTRTTTSPAPPAGTGAVARAGPEGID